MLEPVQNWQPNQSEFRGLNLYRTFILTTIKIKRKREEAGLGGSGG